MVPQGPTTCLFLFPCDPGLRTSRRKVAVMIDSRDTNV